MTLRVISTPLSGKGLTRAALSGSTPPSWYAPRPRGAEEWRARAATVLESLASRDWLSPLMPALEPSGRAAKRLEAAAKDGFVVTAGQQPGLFGGPLYTWWKALSVLAMADALQAATGLPVAPVFWAATDDSDFVEAASTVVAKADEAHKIQLAHLDDPGLPMAMVPVGDLSEQLAELTRAAGSASHSEVLEIVSNAYAPDQTLGSAYVKLLREVLAPLGVAVLDASHTAARSQARGVLQLALEKTDAVEAALLARDAEIKAATFSPQVQTVRGRSLVFSTNDGRRKRLSASHAAQIAGSDELLELSSNVLLRPIVERTILPTVAYLGGPAEIAYFAQVTAVASALDVPAPLIMPRWSGMVIEPRIQKILDRYSLAPSDFADPHAVETRLARSALPKDVEQGIAAIRESAEREIARLADTEGSHLVSDRVLDGLRRNILHRVERLERRYMAAVKREGNEALRDAAAARASLYPIGLPQERALNGIPLMARYGEELFDSVLTEAAAHATSLV